MAKPGPGGKPPAPGGSTRKQRIAARKEARQDARQAARRKGATTGSGSSGGGTSNTNTPTTTTTSTTTGTGTGEIGPTSGDLTSASTTAPVPSDAAAAQSDQEVSAFFGEGTGNAPQYTPPASTTNETTISSAPVSSA